MNDLKCCLNFVYWTPHHIIYVKHLTPANLATTFTNPANRWQTNQIRCKSKLFYTVPFKSIGLARPIHEPQLGFVRLFKASCSLHTIAPVLWSTPMNFHSLPCHLVVTVFVSKIYCVSRIYLQASWYLVG